MHCTMTEVEENINLATLKYKRMKKDAKETRVNPPLILLHDKQDVACT